MATPSIPSLSAAQIQDIAREVLKQQADQYDEYSPPSDLTYHPDIKGYFSPSTMLRFTKAPGGRLRKVSKAEWDAMKGVP